MKTTEEDMENASREGEKECWLEEGECIESSEMESGSWRDCCQSGVNPTTLVYRDKPKSKLELNCSVCNRHFLTNFHSLNSLKL